MAFLVLASTPVRFRFQDATADLSAERPLLELNLKGGTGRLVGLYKFGYVKRQYREGWLTVGRGESVSRSALWRPEVEARVNSGSTNGAQESFAFGIP